MMGFFNWLNGTREEVIQEICVTRSADFSAFNEVTDFIYEKSGITDLDKRALTASRLQQYAIAQDVYTSSELLATMKSNPSFYQEIINIATVNETFFLRELKELEWLIQYIKNTNKNLKILSMPCSSGEEIYSILLMMSREGLDITRVEIRGYDINSDAVGRAKTGEYDEHSLHKIDEKTREQYFTKTQDNRYKISEKFKSSVQFFQKNIFDLVGEKERYDIVLSRNMFIYFDDEKRRLATDIIVDILKKDGVYIKGHADQIYRHPALENIHYGIYKKVFN